MNGDNGVLGMVSGGSLNEPIGPMPSDDPIGNGEHMEFDPAPPNDGIEIDLSMFKRRTGEGDLEEYKNHMFNPAKNEGMAHILRGLTGIIGTDLNFAIADIMVGLFKMTKGRRKAAAQKVPAND